MVASQPAWVPFRPTLVPSVCIYAAFGGNIEGAGEIKHGKTSEIHHDEQELYDQIPQDFVAVRYHSLVGTSTSLPDELLNTSQTENGTMALRMDTWARFDTTCWHKNKHIDNAPKRQMN